jgi:hypothetical protein
MLPKYINNGLILCTETFASTVLQALYTFRLLDQLYEPRRMTRRIVSLDLLRPYLQYRVMNEPTEGNVMLNCIRRLATQLHGERSAYDEDMPTIEAYAGKLCEVFIYFVDGPHLDRFEQRHAVTRFRYIFTRHEDIPEDEYEEYLFSAAVCTNTHKVIRQHLAKHRACLARMKFHGEKIFPHPLRLAAGYGDKKTMECLMTTGVTTVDRVAQTSLFIAAAQIGRFEAVQYVYDFKRTGVPWQFGKSHEPERNALFECLDTPSLEVFTFIDGLCDDNTIPEGNINHQLLSRLKKSIRAGDMAMVQHLLKRVKTPFGDPGCNRSHVMYVDDNGACKRGIAGIDMVELSIKHGMDSSLTVATAAGCGRTNLVRQLLDRGFAPGRALSAAAIGPYFDIVRMLLDAGVDVNEEIGPQSPLTSAISMEHTELFNLLIERGADLNTPGTAEECVKRAKKDGLDSMLSLLKEHGVDVGDLDEDEVVA